MKIIGIDPGTRVTGYGIIEKAGSALQLIDYGCIRPPTKAEPPQRYLCIFNGIKQLIKEYSPNVLVVETQYVHKNVQSAIKLGMARGVAIVAAASNEVSVFEYTPSKAKLAVVGNGRASKLQVQNMIKCLLKLPTMPQPEDAADALALAICHAHTVCLETL